MNWVAAPVAVPLLSGIVALLWGRPSPARRAFVGLSLLGQVVIATALFMQTWDGAPLVLPVGAWGARAGIMLVVDLLSATMLWLSGFVALVSTVYGYAEGGTRDEHPLRLPLVQFLLTGVNLTLCTGDLFNLYVGFEVMLIASFSLLTLEASDCDIQQAFPYVVISLVGSTFFITAAGLTYGLFGTLNYAGIALAARDLGSDPRIVTLAVLLISVFGIKAGVFPLYYWLPNSYPTLPIPLLALIGGVLTKVGVYVLVRMLGTVLPHDLAGVHTALGWVALVTAIVGGAGAISRPFIRGILSFHIVSQVGLMLLAISFMTPRGVAAGLMVVWHNLLVKSSLFLVGGAAATLNRTDDLSRMGHLWRQTPWLGVLFLVQALSLAGVPPLSGFWGKYLLVESGLATGAYALVAGSIVVSMLTLFSMIKIWLAAFWSGPEGVTVEVGESRWVPLAWSVAALAAASLVVGLGAEGFTQVALRAAERLLDQEAYAAAVFAALGKVSQ